MKGLVRLFRRVAARSAARAEVAARQRAARRHLLISEHAEAGFRYQMQRRAQREALSRLQALPVQERVTERAR